MSKLYAATIAIGTRKNATSHTTGKPRSAGAVRSSRVRLRPEALTAGTPASPSTAMLPLDRTRQAAFTSSHILA